MLACGQLPFFRLTLAFLLCANAAVVWELPKTVQDLGCAAHACTKHDGLQAILEQVSKDESLSKQDGRKIPPVLAKWSLCLQICRANLWKTFKVEPPNTEAQSSAEHIARTAVEALRQRQRDCIANIAPLDAGHQTVKCFA